MSAAHFATQKQIHGKTPKLHGQKNVFSEHKKTSVNNLLFPEQYLLAQRKGSSCACGGGCPKCKNKVVIQPRLKVGATNDKYEQEADRVAEQIVGGGSSSIAPSSGQPKIPRMCANCSED